MSDDGWPERSARPLELQSVRSDDLASICDAYTEYSEDEFTLVRTPATEQCGVCSKSLSRLLGILSSEEMTKAVGRNCRGNG